MLQDLKYSLRQLGRQPSFTIIAGLTLALGIGVSTALFSVIDAALLRPLPYPNPEELVTLECEGGARGRKPGYYAPSMEDVRTWRTLDRIIAHAGMGRVSGFGQLIVETGTPQRLIVAEASEDFLETYGITPILGRGIQAGRHARRRSRRGPARPRLLATGTRRRSERARPHRPHPEPARRRSSACCRPAFIRRPRSGRPRSSRPPWLIARLRHAGDCAVAAGRDVRPGAGRPRRRDAAVRPDRAGSPNRFAW